MNKKRHMLTLYSEARMFSFKKTLTLEEFSQETGIHSSIIEGYLDLGILSPAKFERTLPFFDEDAIYRLRRIQRLRKHLGVNLIGAGIISDLMDEIEKLKEEIRNLKGRYNYSK